MTFISYAQNFEDVILWRALKHVGQGFYIDVGAAWPDEHSVTNAFYERGWRGINIEPNPEFYQRLCQQRPRDLNIKVAISDAEGTQVMNFVPETGLSTLDDKIAELHQATGWTHNRQEVQVRTLASVWHDYVPLGQDVHFLKVDVEGFEETALRGNDWVSCRPWVVVVEATLPLSQEESHEGWEPILLEASYQLAYVDGLNRFYIAKEHMDLLPAFKYPPNVFDDFKLQAQQRAESRAAEAESQAANAVSRAVAAEAHLNALVNSTSWRATKPLRVISLGLRNPSEFKVKLQQRAALKERALFWKRNAMTRIGNLRPDGVLFKIVRPLGYERINFGAVSVFFSRAALEDNRGIGRVSRELFQGLRSLAVSGQVNAAQDSKDVYFYSSIHWCPDVLPACSVVMIHDVIPLIFEEHYPDAYLWKGKYKTIAQQANLIVTISESSADDISKYLEVPRERIRVVYNGVTQLPVAETVGFELPAVPFVTYLGAYDWHKNLSVVLKAMQLHDGFDLVMIGNNQNCRAEVTHLGISDRVHFLGSLGDAEVGYVLSKSLALVFPSRYEGFGLPPFEAAFLDVPTICSARPAMSDLLREAALFADPDSPDEWASTVLQLINCPELGGLVASKARVVACELTWEAACRSLVKVFANSFLFEGEV
ncbi:FkbM family methyltransferase [Stutzerimonas stutzeri]|uniref:FkbM family methyltransferase n=1 Tax=Stutzerimonas stutzeri TaxID=316 RepID=UPI0015E2EF8F|nr:FkbM family methyltransferase [Stutzerimonas stutzeri]MBA1225542.1 FkbM family methyltransferase [Stutzerimonas stutzeri]